MAGIFVIKGMGFRIPAGGLTVEVDDLGQVQSSISAVEIRLDVWPYWLEVAIDHAILATSARRELRRVDSTDETGKARWLEAEAKAGMVAVSASAFTLDAFSENVLKHLPNEAALVRTWSVSRTARHKRVTESLRQAVRSNNADAQNLARMIADLYRFRGWAVHPPAAYQPPVLNPDIDALVEWRFDAFRADNARQALSNAVGMLSRILESPRDINPEFIQWCQASSDRLVPMLDRCRLEL